MRYLYVVAALIAALALAGIAAAGIDAMRSTTLSGAEEVPPADPDGSGTADLTLTPRRGKVCFDIHVMNIQTATAAHIHKAPMGMNGPIVVDLSPAPGDADDGHWMGCKRRLNKMLVRDIVRNSTQYYVNVHNGQFPGGAIRGQLGD